LIQKEPLILYGAGELGRLASEFFDFYNIEYIVCDDNPENHNESDYWERYQVKELLGDPNLYTILVCISTASYNTIRDKLIEKGFTNIKPFFQYAEEVNKANGYKHPLTNGWQAKYNYSFYRKMKKMEYVLEHDIYSLAAYIQFRAFHIGYEELIFQNFPINCTNRYFIPEVLEVLHDHETFVDIGAYDGRVTKKFIEIVNGKYNSAIMFEPDENSWNKQPTSYLKPGVISLCEALGDKKY
jgi:hypothetical protein